MTTEITFAGDDNARHVQERIEEALHACAFPEHDIFAIRIAVEEALVNAIRHGHRMDPAKRVHVTFTATAERFDIRITDEGEGFDFSVFDPPSPTDPTDTEWLPRGRGVLLMRHFMTEVQFRGAGNVVTMAKLRSAPA